MACLGVREEDLKETFVRSSGPGGQKVNKTSSCVQLTHLPTGLSVKCQQERSQTLNRFLARRLLLDRIERLQTGLVARSSSVSRSSAARSDAAAGGPRKRSSRPSTSRPSRRPSGSRPRRNRDAPLPRRPEAILPGHDLPRRPVLPLPVDAPVSPCPPIPFRAEGTGRGPGRGAAGAGFRPGKAANSRQRVGKRRGRPGRRGRKKPRIDRRRHERLDQDHLLDRRVEGRTFKVSKTVAGTRINLTAARTRSPFLRRRRPAERN